MLQLASPTLSTTSDLLKLSKDCLQKQLTIGLCHGCFDVTHWGHILHFNAAKREVDVLVVSISSSKIVKQSKGQDRPYYSDKQRLIILNSLSPVDYTYVCEEVTSEALIRSLKPTKYFKGGDYSESTSHAGLGREVNVCKEVGASLRILSEIESYSTTSLIKKIRNS